MARTDHSSELDSLTLSLGTIWTAVVVISALSPDMVSGSEQQHMPVAAFSTWIWGLVASFAVLSSWAALRRTPGRRHLHRPVAVGVATVWAVAAVVSVFAPVMVTGSDPTRLPLAAFVAPVAATVLTLVVRAVVEAVATVVDDDRGRAVAPGAAG
jgi:membrane associated rhomboid family serine protease